MADSLGWLTRMGARERVGMWTQHPRTYSKLLEGAVKVLNEGSYQD